ncbi:MAG TPA: aldehyde dehydrogenase family protein [Allocoleopsis sp.]
MATQIQIPTQIQLDTQVSKFLDQPFKLLMGGQWVDAASGQTFPVYNPATGEVIANVAAGDREDIDRAVKSARYAFENGAWSKLTASERGRLIWKLADLLESHVVGANCQLLSNGGMQMNAATNTTKCVIPVFRSPSDYQAYRISQDSTNRLAIVFDPMNTRMSLTYCVEFFDVGGKTPPNRHQMAVEMFFVLKGEGIAMCDGKAVDIRAGDSILVPPTGIHAIDGTMAVRV